MKKTSVVAIWCALMLAIAAVLPAAAFADEHSSSADPALSRDAALALQFQKLATAHKRTVAVLAEQEIWRLWFMGITEEETSRLAEASMVMQQGALGEALVLLEGLVAEFPQFAEARNQLAFARFLMGDLEGSLGDIAVVMTLEPRHFGALAGRARIEARLGDLAKAQRTMGEVGAIHPWMARLSPIRPDPPPPPPPEVRDL